MENIAQGLSLHRGSRLVTREELARIDTPEATATWRPAPHIAVVEAVERAIHDRGRTVTAASYGVTASGSKLFGVFHFAGRESYETSHAFGIRNSHDKSVCLSFAVGLRVFVCDNMCFSGEYCVSRKHTSGLDIAETVYLAFEGIDNRFERLEERVDELKGSFLSSDEASLLVVRAAEMDAIPSCDILPVLKEYHDPCHEEFALPTRWALLNSFTEKMKAYPPARAAQCHSKLAQVFQLN